MNLSKAIQNKLLKSMVLLYVAFMTLFISISAYDLNQETDRFMVVVSNYIKNSTEQIINEGEVIRLQMNIDQFLSQFNSNSDLIICPKVTLNNKLVASNRCSGFFTKERDINFVLNNSKKLEINLAVDYSRFVGWIVFKIFLFSLISVILVLAVKNSIDKFSEELIRPLGRWSDWAKHLSFDKEFVTPKFDEEELKISEFKNFHQFTSNAFLFQEKFFQLKLGEERTKIEMQTARQVSHDIRSPLAALINIKKDLELLPKESADIIKASIERMDSIADDLLKRKGLFSVKSFDVELGELMAEKNLQHKNAAHIKIGYTTSNIDADLKLYRSTDLMRMISNLINNSVEAMSSSKSGSVLVNVSKESDFIIVEVSDNGPGIPKEIAEKLGSVSVSAGKTNSSSGHGIGVFHAYELMASLGGSISFVTEDMKGTTFTVKIPLHPKIEMILIDDDKLVHMNWKKEARARFVTLHTFFSAEDFLLAHKEAPFLKSIPVYIDFDLSKEQNGLFVAEKLAHMGFLSLSIASGEADSLLSHKGSIPVYIQEVRGKEFPI